MLLYRVIYLGGSWQGICCEKELIGGKSLGITDLE